LGLLPNIGKEVTEDFTATSYLVWNPQSAIPNTTNNTFVPLGHVTWHWIGTAFKTIKPQRGGNAPGTVEWHLDHTLSLQPVIAVETKSTGDPVADCPHWNGPPSPVVLPC
jgi:hypothetical protein